MKNVRSDEWQLYYFNEDIRIEYQLVQCDPEIGFDNESVIIRVTNRTDSKMTLEWHMQRYNDGECNTCNYPDEYHYVIDLAPHSEMTGDCSVYGVNQLKIFAQFIDANYTKGKKLTAFQLADCSYTLLSTNE